LIGSRKFTEGWNSWRVSVMGLMNIGKNEGAQIIQLFGRGVRLKGKNMCLKRSSFLDTHSSQLPDNIKLLETLNVFGIKAEYMAQFKEYLEDEGLPSNEDKIEFILPTISNLGKIKNKLKYLKLKDGVNFKKSGIVVDMIENNSYLRKNKSVVNWYPRIQALTSQKNRNIDIDIELNEGCFTEKHLAFMNIDNLYFDLIQFKNERNWYNFNLDKNKISEILKNNEWYQLYIPKSDLNDFSFDSIRRWEETAGALLKKYCEKVYNYYRNDYEKDKMEYIDLYDYEIKLKSEGKKTNIIDEYVIMIEESQTSIVETLKKLEKNIRTGKLDNVEFGNFSTVFFANHLYEPLLHFAGTTVKISPVSLNEGEKDFVNDLKSYYEKSLDFFDDKQLFLLRNLGRGRGIGFFEANNFHPDFIMWLIVGGKQYITFIDPKGIRNLTGLDDPKIQFYKNIKDLENNLNNPDIILNSFIVSVTPFYQVKWWDKKLTKNKMEKRNLLFQTDDKDCYVKKIFEKLSQDNKI